MAIGVVGKKSGMTRVFTEEGESIPVTVIEVAPNRVTQVKQSETDGYKAIQVTTGARKPGRVSKPMAGHFAKAGTGAGRGLWEFRLDGAGQRAAPDAAPELSSGDELGVEQFEAGQMVDVTGVSKGKGFAGTIKRWNFAGQDRSHGNSLSHRVPGSIGQNQTPGRVFKGKKMAGHMGHRQVTTQNLQVVRVDAERGLLLIKGAVPGPAGSDVYIRPAVKA
jgi:large subunit ribosomal protein L3